MLTKAFLLLCVSVATVAVGQQWVLEEEERGSSHWAVSPAGDTAIASDSAVSVETLTDGIYVWRGDLEVYGAYDNNGASVLVRKCSTSYWFFGVSGRVPAQAYYVEVFGPYAVQRLVIPHTGTQFRAWLHGSTMQAYNRTRDVHVVGLHDDHSWGESENRVLRAPTAHMGYRHRVGGDVPWYGFTAAHKAWPGETVLLVGQP